MSNSNSNNNNNNNKINSNKIAGKLIPAIISVILLVSFDQITKYLVDSNMFLYDYISIIPNVLDIHYIINNGAAWGLLENKQILFYIITCIVLILSVSVYIKLASKDQFKDLRILILLIISGAIGNFIDRIRFKYVIDFIYFKIINFPVFNIADCYVTIGVFIMLFLFIFKYKEEDFDSILKK
ncbi:MAG: signal peptidase II [Lachnospiraceae bacterium]|nr:signal peptidase II [Lachnospiraceae bacterium]